MPAWTAVVALLFAFCLDRWFGEPLARFHPTRWMRAYLGWIAPRIARRTVSTGPNWPAFWSGALAWYGGAALCALAAWLLQVSLLQLNTAVAGLLLGALLKPMLSWRVLRARVADAPAMDTLSRGLGDAVIAPVFWFLVAGLPGAWVYRFSHTAAGLWGPRGFHDGRDWSWAGRWSAYMDQLFSWIPQRLTGWLIAALAPRRAPAPGAPDAASDAPAATRALRLADQCVAVMLAWTCLIMFVMAMEWPW